MKIFYYETAFKRVVLNRYALKKTYKMCESSDDNRIKPVLGALVSNGWIRADSKAALLRWRGRGENANSFLMKHGCAIDPDWALGQTGRYSDSPSRLKDKVSFQDRMGWSLSVVISVISKVELLKRVFVGCDEDSS